MTPHPLILYVDDSLDDRFLFNKAAQRAQGTFGVHTVEHGQDAIDYLTGVGPYADRTAFPVPSLVLLDLKMPVLDGFEVLHWIRQQQHLNQLPVVVFTSSYQHADVQRGYAEGATAFLTKPSMLDELIRLAAALNRCFTPLGVDPGPLQNLPQFKRP